VGDGAVGGGGPGAESQGFASEPAQAHAHTIVMQTQTPAPAVSPYWPRDVAQVPTATVSYPTVSYPPLAVLPVDGGRAGIGPRPRRSLLIIIGVLVVALGVGGGIAYEVLKSAPATPASVVQQYFDDLSRDDTASALTLVANWGQLSSQGPTTLLAPQALSSPSARPTDVRVGNTTTLSGVGGAPGYSVRVTYNVGGTDMTTDFALAKAPSGAKSPY